MLRNIFSGNRPDITPAQVIAAVFGAIGPVLTLINVKLAEAQMDALDDLKVIAIGLFVSDAAIRIGRNVKDGKVEAAALLPTGGDAPAGPLTEDDVPEEAPFAPEEIEPEADETSDPEADALTDEEIGQAGQGA